MISVASISNETLLITVVITIVCLSGMFSWFLLNLKKQRDELFLKQKLTEQQLQQQYESNQEKSLILDKKQLLIE